MRRYFASGLPWWLSDKESACQCRRHGFRSLGRGDPPEKEIANHSTLLASQGQRSRVGYIPRGHKELDKT